MCNTENYRLSVVILVPELKKLDGSAITEDEKQAAAQIKQARDAAAATEAAE